jgi:hypothetical protein
MAASTEIMRSAATSGRYFFLAVARFFLGRPFDRATMTKSAMSQVNGGG